MDSFNAKSLLDRALNTAYVWLNEKMHGAVEVVLDRLFRERLGPHFPSLQVTSFSESSRSSPALCVFTQDITANSAFFMINAIPFIDFAGPTLNKVRRSREFSDPYPSVFCRSSTSVASPSLQLRSR